MMDFFFNLSTMKRGYNRIFVVVDYFSKIVKLISLTKEVIITKIVQFYMKSVYCSFRRCPSYSRDRDILLETNFFCGDVPTKNL
jgi:hypothetical protein